MTSRIRLPAPISCWYLLFCIGPLAGQPVCAQDAPGARSGWFFDIRAVSEVASAQSRAFNLEEGAGRSALWQLAWRRGPVVAHAWQRSVKGHEDVRLTLAAALGLSGGGSAREHIERRLRGRSPTENVFLAFAAGRARVGYDPKKLLRFAQDANRKEVERLAARLAYLAVCKPEDSARVLTGMRKRGLRELVNMICGAYHARPTPDAPAAIPLGNPQFGTLDELELRAHLLLAAARPAVTKPDVVRALVADNGLSPRLRALASLVLGRMTRTVAVDEFQRDQEVDRPMFLTGLAVAPPRLQDWLILEGASNAWSEAKRSAYWAAVTRLVSRSRLARVVSKLLASGSEGLAGMKALCHRLLADPEHGLELDAALRAKLLAEPRVATDRFRIVVGMIAGKELREPPRDHGSVTGTRFAYVLELFRNEQLGRDATTRGPLLWRELVVADWERAVPGAFSHALLAGLNEWVRDLFLGGRGVPDGWLPAGIRESKGDYFTVLDELLDKYPLFR